jgi:hypothetical protein
MAKSDPTTETPRAAAAHGGVEATSPNPEDKGRPEGGGEGHAPAAIPGATAEHQTPGPRNPPPLPPTNAEGFVEIQSVEAATAQAISDDPTPPSGVDQSGAARKSG